MPPKPWETKPRHSVSSEEIKASAASVDPSTLPMSSTTDNAGLGLSSTGGLGTGSSLGSSLTSSPYSSLNSPYGSSSYGSSSMYGSRYGLGGGGGLGSSYGGYGSGYGSSYGMGGGYGGYGSSSYGMGGYGRYGMDPNGQNQRSTLDNFFQFLDSFGFVVNSLCDVSRNLEMNAEGLHRFWQSVFKLFFRMKNWGIDLYCWIVNLFKRILRWCHELFTRRLSSLLLMRRENALEFKRIMYKFAFRTMMVLLVVSFLPILKNFNSDGHMDSAFNEMVV